MKTAIVNICRLALALTFVFSGFVKAVDPLGFQYKLQDYLAAVTDKYNDGLVHDWGTLLAAIFVASVEFQIGICLLFAIQRRITTKAALLFMAVMTVLTVWIYFADPVSDCGCFGDALKLTNGETLLKNIMLLAMTVVVVRFPLLMPRLISRYNQWIVTNFSTLFIICVSLFCLYELPIFDFRPYHVGANIPQGMQIPEGAKQPEFSTTLIYEKDGQKKEFTMENLPDSTWTFIDSETTQISKGYEPPIHDFNIILQGQDITDEVLTNKDYSFLLIAPHLETADASQFGKINTIAHYADRIGYRFICLTASLPYAVEKWQDVTGAEYEFATADETTLKTIVRSSPGLVLLKNGTVYRKWSHNALPNLDETSPALGNTEYGQIGEDETQMFWKLTVGYYLLPLLLLTLLDRIFAGLKNLILYIINKTKSKNN